MPYKSSLQSYSALSPFLKILSIIYRCFCLKERYLLVQTEFGFDPWLQSYRVTTCAISIIVKHCSLLYCAMSWRQRIFILKTYYFTHIAQSNCIDLSRDSKLFYHRLSYLHISLSYNALSPKITKSILLELFTFLSFYKCMNRFSFPVYNFFNSRFRQMFASHCAMP